MPESLVGIKVRRVESNRLDVQALPIEGIVEFEEEDDYTRIITVSGQKMSERVFFAFYQLD